MWISSRPNSREHLQLRAQVQLQPDLPVVHRASCAALCRPMKSSLSKRKGSKAFAKMVTSAKSNKVLGVHFVGPEAAEIVQVSQHVTEMVDSVVRAWGRRI